MDVMAPSAARNSARIAGALYLAIILGGFFAIGYVPATLVVAGDAAATAQNITHNALQLQAIAYNIQQVFYAVYCLLIGYLVYRSTLLPRFVGILLTLGGASYLFYAFAAFVAPPFAGLLVPYIQLPSLVGEASLCVALLTFGRAVSSRETVRQVA